MKLSDYVEKHGLRATARLFGRTPPWVTKRMDEGYTIKTGPRGAVLELVGPVNQERIKPVASSDASK